MCAECIHALHTLHGFLLRLAILALGNDRASLLGRTPMNCMLAPSNFFYEFTVLVFGKHLGDLINQTIQVIW
jgi:hypothetical protein